MSNILIANVRCKEEDWNRGKGVDRINQGYTPLTPRSIPNKNFASVMLDIISQHGKKTAAVDGDTGKSYSYGDLHHIVLKARDGLLDAGVRSGDKVMLIANNNIYYPAMLLTVMLSGATVVPIDPYWTLEALAHIIRVSQANWVIADKAVEKKVQSAFSSMEPGTLKQMWVIDGASGEKLLFDSHVKNGNLEHEKRDGSFDRAKQCAMMPFSSGTTGFPKGIQLSHKNLQTSLLMFKSLDKVEADSDRFRFDVTLMARPLYNIYSILLILWSLSKGCKMIIQKDYVLKDFLEAIQTYKVTFLPIVPHIIKEILESPLTEKYDLSSIKSFSSGSAPLNFATALALKKKLNVEMWEGYGLTETVGVITFNGLQQGFKEGSVGLPVPYMEIKVIDLETGHPLKEGEIGEICARGSAIMMGYANNPEATAEMMDSEGWLHTGDVGYYDQENFVFITDRLRDLLKFKGKAIFPAELENLIMQMKGVKEVAVAGIPDEVTGEKARAWVVPEKGVILDVKEIVSFVADRLTFVKQLHGGAEIVDSLPRSRVGKVLRRELRDSYIASHLSK